MTACACWGSWARIRACLSVLLALSSPGGQVWHNWVHLCSLTCVIPWEEWEANCFFLCWSHCVRVAREFSARANICNHQWSVDNRSQSFGLHWLVNGGLLEFVFRWQWLLQSVDCSQKWLCFGAVAGRQSYSLVVSLAVVTCSMHNICSRDANDDNSLWSLTLWEVR